jgi:hypothetical protein
MALPDRFSRRVASRTLVRHERLGDIALTASTRPATTLLNLEDEVRKYR